MAQPSLLFGQPDARILPAAGNTNVPQPPSFAEFRFTTIGQQPQLLKRISAPGPDYHYQDLSSPEVFTDQEDHSIQSTPKGLSRPTLLQALTAQTNSEDVTMADASDDTVVDPHPVQSTEALFISNPSLPRGLSHFSTTRLDPARPPLGWSDNTADPVRPPSANPMDSALSSGVLASQAQAPISNSPQAHQNVGETSNETSTPPVQPVVAGQSSPTQVNLTPIPSIADPTADPLRPSLSLINEKDSSYTTLRALQSQLFSSLSSLKRPRMDTSHALLLVQAANSHSANALSTAHRVNTLAQQALDAARDAATVAQECLAAAELAKAHASVAVSAVEHIENSDSGGLKNEWEWKTIMDELRGGLCALGQWVGEREGEEAARRREMERAEKDRKHKESVEFAMQMNNGSLSPQLARAMSIEASQTTAAGSHSRSSEASAQTSSLRAYASMASPVSAEVEADAARRAWSVEHRSCPINNVKLTTSAPPVTEEQCEEQRTLVAKQDKPVEEYQAQELQEQKDDNAEIRRVQDLNRQKLEVSQFHIKEREQQEMLQRKGAARRAAEAERLQKEADLLEEQRRKTKEAQAAEVRARTDRAHADKQARLKRERLEQEKLEQQRLEKQKYEDTAREQGRMQDQRCEESRLEQFEEVAASQASQQKEEAARIAAEMKAAEEKDAVAKVYEGEQASEQQKRRDVEELEKKQRMQQAAEADKIEQEKRLREEQEKKRQEVMANKHRATVETAAKIHADRAQKEKERNGGATTSPMSISPPIHATTACAPSNSQSPLTHPLPLPVHQSPTAHVGNLTAKKTVAPQSADASKPRGGALSGGIKLGTADESSHQSQSPTEPTLPRLPSLARSIALGLRENVPPIPKRSTRNVQIASQPQPENNISSAKGLSKTQPPADVRTSLPAKPASQVGSDMTMAFSSDVASSGPVTPKPKSTALPTAGSDYDTPTPMTPVTPALADFNDGKEPPNNNNGDIVELAPKPVSVRFRGQDRGNLHVIPKSKASHASPQAQAANLRFVKDEGGVLWNKYLKPDTEAEVKSESLGEPDALSTTKVKGSGSASPVIPRDAHPESEAPATPSSALPSSALSSPVVPASTLPTLVASSSIVHKPNRAATNPPLRKPRVPDSTAADPATSKTPVPSPTVPTLDYPASIPPKPKLPSFKRQRYLDVDNSESGPNSTPANIATNKGSGTNTRNSLTNEFRPSVPQSLVQQQPATTHSSTVSMPAMPSGSRARGSDPLSLFEDSSAIAPVIQGDGGWDSWSGTPPELSSERLYDRDPAGSTWQDAEPGWDAATRRSVLRRGDHYSPPSVRQPLSNPNRRLDRALPVQDPRSVSAPRLARPRNQTNSGPPRDRTPPPPQEKPQVLGKRRYREDDNVQRQPIRRQQHAREDHVYRPDLARTPPLLEQRPPTPERSGGLQSRIGEQREDRQYSDDAYRPNYISYTAGPAPTQPRGYDSYHPTQAPESEYPPKSNGDSYGNLGRHQVTDSRPDLLDRMDTGSNNSVNPYNNRGRQPSGANGSFRGRRGRGGNGGGGRPLEQRISTSYNNNPLPLVHRIESPPPRYY